MGGAQDMEFTSMVPSLPPTTRKSEGRMSLTGSVPAEAFGFAAAAAAQQSGRRSMTGEITSKVQAIVAGMPVRHWP
jgi:hypothetical protein